MGFTNFIVENFNEFLTYTGFANVTAGNLIMIAVGAFFIWLAIKKDFEPLLLVPIGLGIISRCAPRLVSTTDILGNRCHDRLLCPTG